MPKKTSKKSEEKPMIAMAGSVRRSRAREYLAVILAAIALFLLVCLLSYDPRDPSFNVVTSRAQVSNLGGLTGSYLADALVQLLGISALILPVAFFVMAVRLVIWSFSGLTWTATLSAAVLIATLSVLLERLQVGQALGVTVTHAGGTVGTFLHASFFKFFGTVGEIIVASTVILLSLLHTLRISLKRFIRFVVRATTAPFILAFRGVQKAAATVQEWREKRRSLLPPSPDENYADEEDLAEESSDEHYFALSSPHGAPESKPESPPEPLPESDSSPRWEKLSLCLGQGSEPEPTLRSEPAYTRTTCDREADEDMAEAVSSMPVPWKPLEVVDPTEPESRVYHTKQDLEQAIDEYLRDQQSRDASPAPRRRAKVVEPPQKDLAEPSRPIRVTRRADEELSVEDGIPDRADYGGDYVFPSTDLLDIPPAASRAIDEKVLEQNAAILEQKLADLGIKGEVVEIHPGPVITMYEIILAAGIPLRKVLNTSDDLAMALKSGSTRVVAPIPGKDTVGIEVPNLNREIVYFREIIESPAFREQKEPLKLALGKCIDGQPYATSLVRMPHLLIAGATGTGKSVGLNCLICSWLMSCHPDDVKFLMVDPKRLELSYYQDIPHLIHPVVTEPEKVPKVLSWAIREMERRYELLSKTGAKNIESYNHKVLELRAAAEPDETGPEKLPYIVIIIDELAELMMVAAKDIEISIARLAQMARASGIHLILATQRPSVDVITGVIKANFPARLSYQVSARPDSRTILDTTGAENLLGMGDMLFLPPGTAKLTRLHGAYVSENEIRNIAEFIKAQRPPVYLKEIEKHVAEGDEKADIADLIDDPKYDEAVQLVTRLGHASISLIQRHMRIGYNRAARIIEAMESEGLIGQSDGTSRPREVMARSLDSIPDTPGF
jgi:DNA segregation ATPase FtsK/SpoIIIE, S-DNA-T family